MLAEQEAALTQREEALGHSRSQVGDGRYQWVPVWK